MRSDLEAGAFGFGLVIGLIVALTAVATTWRMTADAWRKDCVIHGVAEWSIDEKGDGTGTLVWKWKNQPVAEKK